VKLKEKTPDFTVKYIYRILIEFLEMGKNSGNLGRAMIKSRMTKQHLSKSNWVKFTKLISKRMYNNKYHLDSH
jgi:hypothetical protein